MLYQLDEKHEHLKLLTYLIDLSERFQEMVAALGKLALEVFLKVLAYARCSFVGDICMTWCSVFWRGFFGMPVAPVTVVIVSPILFWRLNVRRRNGWCAV